MPLAADGRLGITQMPNPFLGDQKCGVSLRTYLVWFESLLAALDAFCWVVGSEICEACRFFPGVYVHVLLPKAAWIP